MDRSKLNKDYYTPSSSGSFGGVNRIKRLNPNVSVGEINKYLQTQDTYTKTKQVKHKFQRRKVMVPCCNYLWQIDLLILSKYKRFNSGYSCLLNCIDAFSRYAYSVPVKKKTAVEICEAFQKILNLNEGKCRFIESDSGTEFKNKRFQQLLTQNGIKIYFNYSDKGACIVERFNRTLMTRIYKYMLHNNTKRYVDVLDDIVKSYNESFHRTIKCSPSEVNEYNEADVWRNINKDILCGQHQSRAVFKEGDYARVKESKGTFTKGYEQCFSNKVYRIQEVVKSIPVTYKLCDGDNNILGTFYKEELSKVILGE